MIFDKLLTFLKIQKFSSELTLLDGTLIQIDGVFGDTNVPVNLVTVDGLQPLPDGDYPLGLDFEGTIITVKDGIITDIVKVDSEEPEVPETPETPEVPVVVEEAEVVVPEVPEVPVVPEDKLKELQDIIDELKKRLDILEGKDTQMTSEFSKMKIILEKVDGSNPILKNQKPEGTSAVVVNSPRYKILNEKK